ncbi:MAG: site-2 protease family protein [Pseudomonadota bacterium]
MSLDAFSLPQLLLVLPIFIAAFILLLTLIVFFHEYGHFSVARLLGVRVDTFSIGFGKPIATWTDKKGTEWRIAWLPLGGYVKFFGDAGPASNASGDVQEEKDAGMATTQFPRPGEEEKVGRGMTPEEKAVCFHFKPLWRRAAIVAAGPIANLF